MIELSFAAPGRPLSINKANSMHWAARKRQLAPWRELVALSWKTSKERGVVKDVPCFVEVDLPFPDRRRRDPHNYIGTVVKALIDELVKCGAWPDDTPEWVKVIEPNLVVGDTCIVRLRPRVNW